MKKYLVNRFGVGVDENDAIRLGYLDDLVLKPKWSGTGPRPKPVTCYVRSSRYIYLPRAYAMNRFQLTESDIVSRLSEGSDLDPGSVAFNGSLRPMQEEAVTAFMAAATDPHKGYGGIIHVTTGGGKTVMAINAISRLRKKTLIVCHVAFLMDQWKARLETYLPDARVGMIRGAKCDSDDADVVIASLMTLVGKRDYDLSNFGFAIFDETHHLGAETFSRVLMRVPAKVRLGLTATIERKDGLSSLFQMHMGTVVYTSRGDQKHDVEIRRPMYSSNYDVPVLAHTGKVNTAALMNTVCADEARTQFVVDTLVGVLGDEPARKTLVLSQRRGQICDMERMLAEAGYTSVGQYIGGMRRDELEISASRDIILATYQMASEGFDVPELNTLVFASPYGSIEQSVGRILRKVHETVRPLVIDVVDDGIFRSMNRARLAFYKTKGYTTAPAKGRTTAPAKGRTTAPAVKTRVTPDDDVLFLTED